MKNNLRLAVWMDLKLGIPVPDYSRNAAYLEEEEGLWVEYEIIQETCLNELEVGGPYTYPQVVWEWMNGESAHWQIMDIIKPRE